jgi:3-hydroxyisobutyrate dehydrogenase
MKKIGWIGTGVMGRSMCLHLINAGYEVSIYNRTKEKAEELLSKGAKWCLTPSEVSLNSDVIFTIVGYPDDVEDVVLGANGVLSSAKKGSIIIDMTTSKPSLSKIIYEESNSKGIFSLDAPVSGGDIGAKEGTLAIMVGGDKEVFTEVLPLFKLMGKNISYIGKSGSGQHTKMSNQILIASTMIGVVEALIYAYKADLDLSDVIGVIGKGAASSWSINNLGTRIVEKNFNPGFAIKHFIKDMGIALEEAKNMKLSLPGLSLAYQFYIAAAALDLENLGTQALYKVFEKINSL